MITGCHTSTLLWMTQDRQADPVEHYQALARGFKDTTGSEECDQFRVHLAQDQERERTNVGYLPGKRETGTQPN